MYVRGPQPSITGGGSPPSVFKWGGGGEIPPHFARIDAYGLVVSARCLYNIWNNVCLGTVPYNGIPSSGS